MGDQSSALEKHLLELLDPSTSPEKALLSLSYPCLTPETYTHGDNEPLLIFLGYMRFIMSRRPDGCLDGIWEEIVLKTFRHSRYFTGRLMLKILILTRAYSHNIFTWVDPEIILQMKIWFHEALSTRSKCPNPYIRLELFRLLTVIDMEMKWECLCETFINAICEINPHRFYPSLNEDDLLFDISNFNYIIVKMYGKLMAIISSDKHKDINGAKFVSHIMQMIVIFTVRADSNPIIGTDRDPISYCCNELHNFLHNFKHMVSCPPIRPYLVEAVRELTAVVINSKERDAKINLRRIHYRDDIVADLDVCSKPCYLPRLLLQRQVQGPRQVRQHSLLLRDLSLLYKDEKTFT